MTAEEIRPLLVLDTWEISRHIRTVNGVRYLTPPTAQWACWTDSDAVRCHGVRIGKASADDVRRELENLALLDAWDHHRPGAKVTRFHYTPAAQFALLHTYSVDMAADQEEDADAADDEVIAPLLDGEEESDDDDDDFYPLEDDEGVAP